MKQGVFTNCIPTLYGLLEEYQEIGQTLFFLFFFEFHEEVIKRTKRVKEGLRRGLVCIPLAKKKHLIQRSKG